MAGQLEDTLGGPPVDVTLAGTAVPGDAVGPLVIRRWRAQADPDTRPDAAQLSLTLLVDKLTTAPQMGAAVTVELSAAATAYFGTTAAAVPRFAGKVTDLVALPVTRRQPAAQLQLVAVGSRAQLGNLKVGDVPWPQEADGDRAARVLAAAVARRPELVLGLIDPGTVEVLARDVDRQDAQGLLDALATDSGGELVEARDGSLEWRDAMARANAVELVELNAGNVLAPAVFRQGQAGMVNDLELAFGPATPDQATVRVTDTVAAAAFGLVDATQATQLADADEATTRATDIVGRRSRPRWRMDDIAVELLRTVDQLQAAALLESTFGSLVAVTGLPTSSPFITMRGFIEGQTETITRDGWQLVLGLTDKGWTGAAPRWADIPGAAATSWRRWDWATRSWVTATGTSASGPSWQDVDPTLTWLGAASWDPGDYQTDRWLDQPASLRWEQVPATTTWATY